MYEREDLTKHSIETLERLRRECLKNERENRERRLKIAITILKKRMQKR